MNEDFDRDTLYPLYDFLSQQNLDHEEMFIKSKDNANYRGKLWEKFIRKKINEFIINNPDKLAHVSNLKINDGYIIKKIKEDNYFVVDRKLNIKSELDGLYVLPDKSLLIVESKSHSEQSHKVSKYQIKTRIIEQATSRKSIFLKIRPTDNETLGLTGQFINCRKIILRNSATLQRGMNHE